MQVRSAAVDIPTPDGTADAFFAAPAEGGPYPAVLLFMDAFGLRPRLEDMASRLAGHGYAVLVPNLFHRHGRAPLLDTGALLDPAVRERVFGTLRPMMAELTPDRAASDADAYLDALRRRPEVAPGPVGAVGYCMGGALAIRAAAHRPDDVAAVGSFHGARLATDAPESPHLLADRIRAELYVASADGDTGMPPEQQRRLDQALTAAGVTHTCVQYDGARHGWTMADTAAYDEAATERHWEALLELFGRTLQHHSG
ncbi:dienelactone hydrolase family protein [Nakamurella endophytica]|uniref:Hydrolase n=1 Tax=Nakamurella endophytica TaxID=1748367 RepID=A0A917WJA8_9ACTN|nr:dienelactone hydrolase family protein [Nakamurella endophytica]GGM07609.1 hydrolase [Nakamurella endophytica]